MFGNEFIRWAVFVLLFPAAAFSFKAIPDNYPELHKQNRFISYHGFNIAFMDFEKDSFLDFKKRVFRELLIAGTLQFISTLLCFLLFPHWDKGNVIESFAAIWGFGSLAYLVYRLIKTQ